MVQTELINVLAVNAQNATHSSNSLVLSNSGVEHIKPLHCTGVTDLGLIVLGMWEGIHGDSLMTRRTPTWSGNPHSELYSFSE